MKPLVFVAILALCLGAAIVNVVGKQADAKASAIHMEAMQRAANQGQARRHRDEQFRVEQAQREAIAPYEIAAKQNIIWTLGVAGIVVVIVAAAAGSYWVVGESRARVKAATLRANLIPLDAITRQYPLFIHETRGRYFLVNPNTHSVMKLNEARLPLPQLAEGAIRVQMLGVNDGQNDVVLLNDPPPLPRNERA